MKKTISLVFVLTLFTLGTYAHGPAEKVTGEFTHNDRFHRLVSAHEAMGKNLQKGFFLSWRDDGRWYEIDFWDTEHSCVNVFAEGQARIGGLVREGNEGAPQIGRYFGLFMIDGGEPGPIVDQGFTYRVTTDYWSEEARLALLNWCETGELGGLFEQAVWPSVVTDGNLQVHNSPRGND